MSKHVSLPVRIVQYLILVAMALFAIYPLWFAVLASGREGARLVTFNLAGMFLPLEWSWLNYQTMFFDKPLLTWLRNSLYVAGITTVASILISTSAAFAFSRFKFYGREAGLILMLAIQTFPGVLSLVAVAQLLTAMGLYARHEGLILAYTVGSLVFSTYNLKGYFDTIPIDLEEAAMIDGAGPIQSFLLIALPLARPALAVTALLGFLSGWGDYIFASVLIPAPESMQMLVPALYSLANDRNVPWGEFAAGGLVVVLPTMIVFTLVQRYFQAGLTVGGVKG